MPQIYAIFEDLFETLIPIGICVVLPITVVWLYIRSKTNETNRRTEIVMAALDKGQDADLESIIKSLASDKKQSTKWKIISYLRWGCILTGLGISLLICAGFALYDGFGASNKNTLTFSVPGLALLFIGLAFLIVYFISRRFMAKEITDEENQAEDK